MGEVGSLKNAPLCVFDLDGTLVDSLPDLAESLREMLATYGLPKLSDERVRPMVGDGVGVLVSRGLAAVEAHGIDHDEAVRRYMAIYEPRATRLTRLFPGTRETIEALRAAGFNCALCTNKPVAAARIILERFELAKSFAAIAGGDSFPVRKPDPEHVRRTVALAGGTPDQAVMVGDHRNDVVAGNGAGLRTIFADWGYGAAAMGDQATAIASAIEDAARIMMAWFKPKEDFR